MATAPGPVLCGRKLAILRAAAEGRVESVPSVEPDLFVDGLACCDQMSAHELAHDGFIALARPGAAGERVPVEVTRAGRAALETHRAPRDNVVVVGGVLEGITRQ